MAIKLTVFFDDPFWVGVFERTDGQKLSAARVVFGAEPRDTEVYLFIHENFSRLEFGGAVDTILTPHGRTNPKRLQREAERAVKATGIGTKAQQALQAQYEARKAERKTVSRAERERLEKEHYRMKQEKKKEKKKGH